MDKKISLQPFIAAVPVVAAVLYFFGICYYRGFLKSVGLEEGVFLVPVDRLMFIGFYVVASSSVPGILWVALAVEGLVLVAFVFAIFSLFRRVRYWAWLLRRALKRRFGGAKMISGFPALFLDFAASASIYVGVGLMVFLAIVVLGSLSEKSGVEVGGRVLNKIKKGEVAGVELSLAGVESSVVGYSLLCSSTHCAYVIDGRVVVLRHEKIDKVVVKMEAE